MALAQCFAWVSVCAPAAAQPLRSLEQVNAREETGFAPVNAGKAVKVHGIVNSAAFRFPDYLLLAFDDGKFGAVLKQTAANAMLDTLVPGAEIEVEGTIETFHGMPVIVPVSVIVSGKKPAPEPIALPAALLMDHRYLGRLVRADLTVKNTGDAENGDYLDAEGSYRIFIPRGAGEPVRALGFHEGEVVRATGVAYQFCSRPPYNRNYQLLVSDPRSLDGVADAWTVSPWMLGGGMGGVLLVAYLVWNRERKQKGHRERLRKTYELGEEVLGSPSAEAILERLSCELPGILGVTRVRLYAYNRGTKALDPVMPAGQDDTSISLATPAGATQPGAVACYHYRTLLAIPDTEKSPFPISGPVVPKSLLFVPMLAQGSVVGVLELDQDDRVREFRPDERERAQHLGNQTGVALRLLEQRSVQEQLFRTEKLAAVGRLITGVVNELQTPLASISDLAQRAVERESSGPAAREAAAIASEAKKAAGMVARLVSFASAEQGEARPVSVHALLQNLIEFREGDWKASGIRVNDLTNRDSAFVLGSEGQLEQVFLNLLVHAELSLADAPQKTITIRTSVLAKRMLVEISFTAPGVRHKPEESAAVLGVTRSVIAGHGGEVRLLERDHAQTVFEVELPVTMKERTPVWTAPAAGAVRNPDRTYTALVVDPDESVQRQILALLAARGYRVVPVSNSDTGLDLAQRVRFDAAFISVHAPGLNWVELSERLQSRVGAFVLVSDSYDQELSADFEEEGRFVLPRPIQEADLDRVLRMAERPQIDRSVPITRHGAA
jgi:signal transduction histidine kinase/CheY-like chemotaxis protein